MPTRTYTLAEAIEISILILLPEVRLIGLKTEKYSIVSHSISILADESNHNTSYMFKLDSSDISPSKPSIFSKSPIKLITYGLTGEKVNTTHIYNLSQHLNLSHLILLVAAIINLY